MKLTELKPLEKNPYPLKSDAELEKLKQSILGFEKMMSIRKIVIDENNVIWGGNKRYFALKALGYKEIPDNWIDKRTDLNEDEKKEFAIRDNIGFGSWDMDVVEEWGVDAEAWGLEVEGFESDEVLEAKEDDYEEPEQIKTDIVLGDLFEIGDHRLLCGDSTCSDSVAKLMDGEKADMVFTDPPYNAAFNGRSGKFEVIENDNLSDKDFDDFMKAFFSTIELNKCNEMYVCCDWRMYLKTGNYFNHNQLIVWSKDIPCMGKGYRNKHEFIMYSGNLQSNTETNVWDEVAIQSGASKDDSGKGWFQGGNIQLRIHPTQKPVAIPSKAINNSSKIKDIVLDLFLGSGTTMVASHQLKRKCYGMELDPKYCQVIIDRMKKLDTDLVIKKNGIEIK